MKALKDFLIESSNIGKLYHITWTPDIKQFEIRYREGMGTSFYGAGVYFAKSLSTIEYYKDLITNEHPDEELYLYTVTIKPSAHIYNEDDKDKGGSLYLKLCNKYGGDELKATAEIVKKYKVDGIEYSNEEDGNSVVIYNPSVIKINKVEKING